MQQRGHGRGGGGRCLRSSARSAGGRLDVCAGTEFLWQDGCVWTSAQRVSGSLADDVLVFGYDEAPKTGQAGCASACTASGSIDLR